MYTTKLGSVETLESNNTKKYSYGSSFSWHVQNPNKYIKNMKPVM